MYSLIINVLYVHSETVCILCIVWYSMYCMYSLIHYVLYVQSDTVCTVYPVYTECSVCTLYTT